jgi:thiol-disulfide isomerase/thioredoxin
MKKLLVFGAAWCAPCKVYKPTVAEFSDRYPEVEVTIFDVDDDRDKVEEYNIKSVPTTILIDDSGTSKNVGALSIGQLKTWLDL